MASCDRGSFRAAAHRSELHNVLSRRHITGVQTPCRQMLRQAAYLTMSAEKRAALAERWALAKAYFRAMGWVSDALAGDLGYSLEVQRSRYTELIVEESILFHRFARRRWCISGVAGFFLGVAAGVKRGTAIDTAIRGYCYVLSTSPTFWLGLIALMVFAVRFGWFPLGFSIPIGESSVSVLFCNQALSRRASRACLVAYRCGKHRFAYSREDY